MRPIQLSFSLIVVMIFVVGNAQPPQRRPNIVFVMSDDQGYHDIGYHGSDLATPHLDALASEGVKLENYYVQPVCSPSRSQLLSGRYQIHTGLQHRIIRPSQPYGLPLEFPTLADVLRQQGYTTHAVGKWHLGFPTKEYTPLQRGFDTFYGILTGSADHYTYWNCDAHRSWLSEVDGTLRNSSNTTYCGYALRDNDGPSVEGNETYSTHLYTEKAIQHIKAAATTDNPMFLYLAYQAPHSPLQVPEEYQRDFTDIANHDRRIYAGMMKALDEAVKNVTNALKSYNLWNNTIFIFSSDNGAEPALGGNNWPLRGVKTTLWEGGMKTIGFVTSPLIGPEHRGKVSLELMHVSDWFPTISAMAGIQLSPDLYLDGVNQWPMIRDGEPGPRNELLHNIDILSPLQGSTLFNNTFDTRFRAAIRVGDYKLITGDPGNGDWYPKTLSAHGYQKPPFWQPFSINAKNLWLFNVIQDPFERNDLSHTMPGKVREMLDKLVNYQTTARNPWYPDSDPNCDPQIHRGYWEPWM